MLAVLFHFFPLTSYVKRLHKATYSRFNYVRTDRYRSRLQYFKN